MASGKSSLARDSTMRATAKEAISYLYPKGQSALWPYVNNKSHADLLRSQGLLQPESSDAASASKPSLQRDSTMAKTAKEAKGILGGSKLGDTRQVTAKNNAKASKSAMKRGDTMSKTVEEAKLILGGKKVDITEGRKTRSGGKRAAPKPVVKRAGTAPKPAMKRAGTMQKTAKEGKNYLKRTKGKGQKGKGRR